MEIIIPEENDKIPEEDNQDVGKDIETVVSNNENIDPIPDDGQLEEKKKADK
jgi:hypothetical protein